MKRSSLILLLLALSATASAEFDYDYLQLGYGIIEIDDIDVDGDGFKLAGSYAINSDVHVFGDFQAASLDFGVDLTAFTAGIGYNTELSPTVDAFARLSYEYIELEAPGVPSADDNGFGLGVGLRFAATDKLELDAGIKYVDYSDSGNDTGLELAGLYDFTEAFTLGLTGDWTDDVSTITLVARLYFGR
jgi:opacity protein-like surface antigen